MTDGEWTSHKTEPETYNPNDFITFRIASDASGDGWDGPSGPDGPGGEGGTEGNLLINIKIFQK